MNPSPVCSPSTSMTRIIFLTLAFTTTVSALYNPLQEYAGQNFFNGWDFAGAIDDTTWGNVTYLDQASASTQKLAYVNDAGNAIIKVDNTTTIASAELVHRNSIKITSQDTYLLGNLIIFDAVHLPYGCSVWPSFWTLGSQELWPVGGEIDIIEGINMMGNNQMALHSTAGCAQGANAQQSGQTLNGDCSLDRGCIVAEKKPNSFGAGFAQAGGGVFAIQMDVSGFYMWFWSRPDVPPSIKSATSSSTMDTVDWGLPSAAYPVSGCNFTEFFLPQHLILDITLCGSWAGIPSLYSQTCHTPTGSCVADNIIGPGSPTYDQAYFEISYIRTYVADTGLPPTSTGGSASTNDASSGVAGGGGAKSTVTTTVGVTGGSGAEVTQSAGAVRMGVEMLGLVAVVSVLIGFVTL